MAEFKDMNKKELQAAAKLYKLEDDVQALNVAKAKEDDKAVPKEPTNAMYVEILEGYKVLKDEEQPADVKAAKAAKESGKAGKIGNQYSSKGQTQVQVRTKFLHTKVAVKITDHDNSTSTEEEKRGRVINIGWGNKRGKETARIPLNAGVQYVKEGAIKAMESVKIPTHLKTSTIRDKQRFGIEMAQGWDEQMLEKKKAEQKAR